MKKILILLVLVILYGCHPWDIARNKSFVKENIYKSNYKNQMKINGVYYIYNSEFNLYSNSTYFWENGLFFTEFSNQIDSLKFFLDENLDIKESAKRDPLCWGIYKIENDIIHIYKFGNNNWYSPIEFSFKILNDTTLCSYNGHCGLKFQFRELNWKPDTLDIINGYYPNYMK